MKYFGIQSTVLHRTDSCKLSFKKYWSWAWKFISPMHKTSCNPPQEGVVKVKAKVIDAKKGGVPISRGIPNSGKMAWLKFWEMVLGAFRPDSIICYYIRGKIYAEAIADVQCMNIHFGETGFNLHIRQQVIIQKGKSRQTSRTQNMKCFKRESPARTTMSIISMELSHASKIWVNHQIKVKK